MTKEFVKYHKKDGSDAEARERITRYYKDNRKYMSPIPAAILTCEAMKTHNYFGLAKEFGELDDLLHNDLEKALSSKE